MDKAKAAQEVIKLKKSYGTGGDDKQISQQAEMIRQQAGLDDAKYGSDASLADAYTNYHMEYGKGSQQQTQQVQGKPMEGSGQTSALQGLGDFYQQSSNDFLSAQTANFDKQLSQQIASLESSYAQAISEGKISVRDAESQFLEQKASIEQQAYQQAEATKGYGSEMGIANSQQMMGIQQGDNARVRSANNGNMSTRDKRIADITDRISALSTQKNLAIGSAQADYGYNIAGAQAQASQMYNQSMGGLMQEDYFADKTQTNAEKNMAIGQGYNKENMAIQQGYTKENSATEQGYRKELADFQNNLDISKMWVGHEINLKEFDAQLENQFKIIDKNFSIDKALQGSAHSNAMKQISANARASAQVAQDEYKIAMDREARRLGLPPGYDEKTISDALKAEGKQALSDEIEMKREAGVLDAMKQAEVEQDMLVFQNPNLALNPVKPPSAMFSKTKQYEADLKAKTDAENALLAIQRKYGMVKPLPSSQYNGSTN